MTAERAWNALGVGCICVSMWGAIISLAFAPRWLDVLVGASAAIGVLILIWLRPR
jgi:hypothetical protein